MDVDVAIIAVSGSSYYYFSVATMALLLVVTAADVTLAVDANLKLAHKNEECKIPALLIL